jgi:hypothetical protein
MIETAIRDLLRSNAPLMALLSNSANRVDLLDVGQNTPAPYLTFNADSTVQAGRPNLCNPASLGLLRTELLITPWAKTAPEVAALNAAARAALVSAQPRTVAGVTMQSIAFSQFGPWAREPETNLLTRGQVFLIAHTE